MFRSSASGIYGGSWLCIRHITIRRARTWHCGRMHRYGDLSKDREPLLPHQFCSDCIIATRGYDFREGHAAPGMGNPMKKAFGEQNRRMLGIGPKQTESLWQRSAVNGPNRMFAN